jgi:hypothetical protein
LSDVIIPYEFLCRGGTAAAVAAWNGIPKSRQFVVETDTGKFKLGDGATNYNDLPYAGNGAASEITYDNSTSGLAAIDVQAAIDEVAAKSTTGAWTTVKKGTDQSRNSTTTLADDSTLKMPLAAGTRYHIRAVLMFQVANGTMDFKVSPAYSGTINTTINHRQTLAQGASAADGIGEGVSYSASTIDFSGAGVGFCRCSPRPPARSQSNGRRM